MLAFALGLETNPRESWRGLNLSDGLGMPSGLDVPLRNLVAV